MSMPGTMIVVCSCQHGWQDRIHGEGKRVANYLPPKEKKSLSIKRYRCTVCGKEHTF